jgi:hypothetical protein
MRPVILCCPTRNELHNLCRLVPAWSLYTDHIVIADQMSTDGSREFLSRFKNVHVVDNKGSEFNESDRISLLLAKARSLSDSAVLLFLDADETLSANVTKSLEWQSFLNAPAGTTGYFPWVTLWGSNKRYIARGTVGQPVPVPFAFLDDGRALEGATIMHGPRMPGAARPERRFYFNDVVNLHFFLTNKEVYRKKQNWYKLFWLKKGGRFFHTNRNHTMYDKVGLEQTEAAPLGWYLGFEDAGIDLSSAWSSELLWYDVEILQYIKKNGARSLWLADIWNQDWEYLRELATRYGHPGIPEASIGSPPAWIALYNDLVLGRITVRKTLHSLGRFAMRRILP